MTQQATPCQAEGASLDGLRVWDTKRRCWLTAESVRAGLQAAPIVLLGEQHDHPVHHVLQARVLQWLAEAGRQPSVVFEMLETTQQPILDAAQAAPREAGTHNASAEMLADGLAADVDWDASGWPPWPLYRPIFVTAFRHDLTLVAGGLPREAVRQAMREGNSALPAHLVSRHALHAPLPPDLQAALIAELDAAHCHMLPEAMHGPMALIQRARDAQMAELLDRHADGDGAVLIAGAGHVRNDRGVPWYLRRQGREPLSIAFRATDTEGGSGFERETGVTSQDERARVGEDHDAAPYDWVWWTEPLPDADEADPCEALRNRHEAAQAP